MSGPNGADEFVRGYIAAWSTTDAKERRSLIDQLYADDAVFFADEPGDEAVQRHGRDEIEENITQVNERLTQGNVWVPKMSSGHAASVYSWMTPPIRSRRRVRNLSRSETAAGSDRSGAP